MTFTTTTMSSLTMISHQQQQQYQRQRQQQQQQHERHEDWEDHCGGDEDDDVQEGNRNHHHYHHQEDLGRPSSSSSSSSSSPSSLLFSSTTFAVVVVCFAITLSLYLLPRRRQVFYSNNNSNNYNHTTDNLMLSDFYDTIWPPIQRTLCPDRRPELMYTQILFAIGRYEFGLNSSHNNTNKVDKPTELPSKFIQKFFVGGFGGVSIYMDGDDDSGGSSSGPTLPSKLNTMYIRIWKCGNNQIRHFEKELWQRMKIRNGTYIEQISLFDVIHKYPQLLTNKNHNGTGLSSLCTYTVVRDPISHFLSGYNEADYRLVVPHKDRKPGKFNWTTPTPYFNISFTESDSSRRRRFTQLVEDVLTEREELTQHYVFQHFFSMSRILPWLHSRRANNLTLTGYIPSLHNLEQTWPQFMSDACHVRMPHSTVPHVSASGEHYTYLTKLPGHRSSKDELGLYQASKDVWSEQGHVSRALCAIHAMDYACWTDLPDGIPQLCQDVYSTEIFRESILNYR